MLAEFAEEMGTQMLLLTGPAPILKLIQEPTCCRGSGFGKKLLAHSTHWYHYCRLFETILQINAFAEILFCSAKHVLDEFLMHRGGCGCRSPTTITRLVVRAMIEKGGLAANMLPDGILTEKITTPQALVRSPKDHLKRR
jgi:hypothetical protein